MTSAASHRLNALGIAGLLGLFLIGSAVQFGEVASIGTSPINGTFQLYNPLERMARGEPLGGDLVFFHGFGTLLAHFPLFALLGGDLAACVVSKRAVSVVAYLAVILVCARAWRIPWQAASIAFLALLGVDWLRPAHSIPMMLPGNSLLGMRSALAAAALPLALLLARRFPALAGPHAFHALIGSLIGGAMFISTEQGFAVLAATLGVLALFPFQKDQTIARRLTLLATLGLSALATCGALLAIVTGRHAIDAARYLFVEVPSQQFWYFGGPPNGIPDSLAAVMVQRALLPCLAGTLILLAAEWRWITRLDRGVAGRAVSITVLVLLVYGLVAQAAQLSALSPYHLVLFRNAALVGLVWGLRIAPCLASRWPGLGSLFRAPGHPAWWFAPVVILAMMGPKALAEISAGRPPAGAVRHGGLPLSPEYAAEVEVWHKVGHEGAKAASTYSSLIEDITGTRHGGPDYIIHGLGSRREAWLRNVRSFDPDFFLTLNPAWTPYEEWVQLRHWDLYQDLIAGYEPVATSPYHVFWKKSRTAATDDPLDLGLTRRDDAWLSNPNPGPPAIFTARVRYRIDNPLGRIPVFGKVTRFLVDRAAIGSDGTTLHPGFAASLPPGESVWEFPIFLATGERASLRGRMTMNWPRAAIAWEGMELQRATSDPRKIAAILRTPTSTTAP